MDIWREFEHNEITHSGAHYLMTVQQLIEESGYARVSDVARDMHRQTFITFLKTVLHIDAEQAEIDACKIEHLISTKTGERLLLFLQFLLSDDLHGQAFLKSYWDTNVQSICDLETCAVCEEVGECLVIR